MKKLLFVTLLLFAILACTTSLPCQPTRITSQPTHVAPQLADMAWDDRALFRAGLVGTEQATLDSMPGASVYHLDFEVAGDFSTLEGHEEVLYTNREEQPLDEVYFRLFPNTAGGGVTISALTVDDREVEPVYGFADSAMRVPLPKALQPGAQVVIGMDFEVEVPREMGGDYGLFGYFDGVLVLDEFYPVIPVYDDEGWNVEVPPPNADVPYYDASFYVVRVTAPAKVALVASGVEVGREYEEGAQVVTFAAGPARGFYLAAAESLVATSQVVGETTVKSYAFAEWGEGSDQALQVAVDALESFNARFGTYPYTEFEVVNTPMLALGMEYPGVVAISLALYDPDGKVGGLPAPVILESAVAHEVGHQWFYNVVGNDQVDEPWVDEAVVQYITGLYYRDTYGEAAERSYRDSWEDRWARVGQADIPIGLPAVEYEGAEYGAIVYGRGPIFIALLEEEMGRETFDAFLRDYYESYKWDIGTGEAFKQLAEVHCACDLSPLFDAWVAPPR
ncbi:MAG: M1 family metallopeptidase [Anaerolineae bacterium]|nr:M1 family metallopeptidase [Anaerolineae bacterium]